MRTTLLLTALLTTAAQAQSQTPAGSTYNPYETFAPFGFADPVNIYRSSDGAPGPGYWQNRADYDIHAKLDPAAKTLSATETITYVNNSPDKLASLWLQLDQNVYRQDSRASVASDRRARQGFTDGYSIDAVAVLQGGVSTRATPFISDTRMRIALQKPLLRTETVKLQITYHYTVPGSFGGRTSWIDTRNGPIFDIAQWFPRMCVYDDIHGWDTLPYIVQEFYLDYGNIDYAVTVPADMLVLGDGVLVNEQDVLTPEQRQRLAKARDSDATVTIRGADELAAPAPQGQRTWRYHMANTRDVAFSASRAFIWDAARINLPGGKTALAESAYPIESAKPADWPHSTEYLKDSVENFSRRWYPYPYSTAWNIAGGTSGMEYPGLAFDGIDDGGRDLFWITAHEIGHTWFPMTVGFDERRNAWMDEGFNTFIDTFESDDYNHGIYGPKRDPEYAPGGGNPADEIVKLLADPDAPPILTRADVIPEKYRHPVTYFKSAFGLTLLRNEILGPRRFDAAFRKFIADWAFKHPKPSDFFRAMESEGGEDLAYWWRGWYANNWQLDFAVTGVDYIDNNPAHGARVSIATLDKLIIPTVLEVRYAGGATTRIAMPAETWILGGHADITLPGGPAIISATIDPDHTLPDRNRANNTFGLAVAK
jgi:hypothetical protein